MELAKYALKRVNVNTDVGLEIGPLYRPVVKKGKSKIFYLERVSTVELKKYYKKLIDSPKDLENIVDVDFALNGSTLRQTIGNKKFDYVIASHVIEHVPNMVEWLEDIAHILKPGGILSLIIPDKRYTFDVTRAISRPSDIVGDYLDKPQKNHSAAVYDYYSELRKVDAGGVWANMVSNYHKLPHLYTEEEAFARASDNSQGTFVDTHCYVFTPSSFFEIMKSLFNHNLVDFEVAYFHDTTPGDLQFFVSLRKIDKKKKTTKDLMATVPRIQKDKTEQKLSRENEELKNQLSNIVNSRSWKITGPLRAASYKLKNLAK